ncbi:hypothetical protein B566_EDAN014880 [Ephemera danica]|nr:hypothetical protein B566_EDAN014880 [Ephemera danica]
MTTNDERNFRSSYYEKVGFRNVEEKKSLDILLKDKPLDIGKLLQFCLRFTLPGIYRNLLWKVLLDVLPVHVESHLFVWEQRQAQYHDLHRALNALQLANPLKTEKYEVLPARYQPMSRIPNVLFNIFEDEVDVFWISKGFFQCVEKFHKEMPKLIECTLNCLEIQDLELYSHLVNIGAIEQVPLSDWFYSCFAGVLHEAALSKIWDKLVGGSCKILVFVAVVYITTLKRALLTSRTAEDISKSLKNVSEESADIISNKAIELWQQHGSCLTPGSGAEGIKCHANATRKAAIM